MKDFATQEKPLRASRLPALVLCYWRAVAEELHVCGRDSGKAADTGSAVHLAISSWHLNGKSLADACAAMRDASAAFPLADLHEAERIFSRYSEDTRNQTAEIVACEAKVELSIEPKYIAGPPVVIVGTLDQLRFNAETGNYEVWDVKTGIREGLYFQTVYALQLAAYTLAARRSVECSHKLTRRPVVAGGYIRTKGYFTRGAELPSPRGVFIPADIPDPDALLDAVRWAVCAVRSGYIIASPGEHCGTCGFAGNAYCLPKLQHHFSGVT